MVASVRSAVYRVTIPAVRICAASSGQRTLHAGGNCKQSSTPPAIPNLDLNTPVTSKLALWMRIYEDFVGLTEVKEAQQRVIQAEKKFVECQEIRRARQLQMQQIQLKLKEIHTELDKIRRGDDKYLKLVTEEHAIIKEERVLADEFQFYEKAERDTFSVLSNAVRDSHERERAYAEKTKYWSVIGSVCGAIIGILGTTVNNWVRLKELRSIVYESAGASTPEKLRELASQTSEALQKQGRQLEEVTDSIKAISQRNSTSDTSSQLQTPDDLADSVKRLNESVSREMKEIRSLLNGQPLLMAEGSENEGGPVHRGEVVYLRRDVETLVRDAQTNLEWKIKVNSLATVAMIYGAIAVTLPLLYKIFGGSA